eukprot:7952462-Pyramimonas_sp.AAC.1
MLLGGVLEVYRGCNKNLEDVPKVYPGCNLPGTPQLHRVTIMTPAVHPPQRLHPITPSCY